MNPTIRGLIIEGRTDKQIAQKCGVSEGEVALARAEIGTEWIKDIHRLMRKGARGEFEFLRALTEEDFESALRWMEAEKKREMAARDQPPGMD